MDKVQKKMMEFQVLEANLSIIRSKHEEAMKRLEELEITKHTIGTMKDMKPSDAMIPIGSNNFIRGKVEDTDSIIVGIGGGVAVKKKRADAVRIIDGHEKELKRAVGEFAKEEQHIVAELQKLQPEIQKMIKGK